MFDNGMGPPVVVVPGVQGRWEWTAPALGHLQTRCRTISYSLCGDFGSACRPDPSRGFENYLLQLDRIFEAARLTRAAVCGISYGGLVALRYAATRPDRVTGLVIASSPAPGWKPTAVQSAYIAKPLRSAPRFVLSAPLRLWPEIRAAFPSIPAGLAFLVRHGVRVGVAPMRPTVMAGRIVEQQRLDFCPDCARVRVPTLVITGEPHLDRIVPVESTRRYLDLIPHARYATLKGTGHLGSVTHPGEFAQLVGDFVRTHSPLI